MDWLTGLFSKGAGLVVDSVGNAVDKLVTSDEERLALKNELHTIRLNAQKESGLLASQANKEITKRWGSDNEHFITRLVRPVSYIWVVILFSFVVLLDGNLVINGIAFSIKEAYIPVIETLLSVMTVAYFGSRGIEKVQRLRTPK